MANRLQTTAAFGAVFLIWGTTYLAIERAVVSIPPVFMVAARGMLAGGLLYLCVRVKGGNAITLREIRSMLPTAALLFGGGYVLVGWAEQHVQSGSAALLNATTPAWVVLFEWIAGRRTRPDLRFSAALLSGVAGVAVLVGADAQLPLIPAIALVIASVAWAAGTVRTRMRAHGDPIRDAAVQLITGGVLLMPVSIAAGEMPAIFDGGSASSITSLGYLVLFGSVIAYSSYVWLLHHVSATKVSSHSYVNPLIAVIVGSLFAGESIGASTVVAGALIVFSVFFIVSERPVRSEHSRETLRPSPRPRIAA